MHRLDEFGGRHVTQFGHEPFGVGVHPGFDSVDRGHQSIGGVPSLLGLTLRHFTLSDEEFVTANPLQVQIPRLSPKRPTMLRRPGLCDVDIQVADLLDSAARTQVTENLERSERFRVLTLKPVPRFKRLEVLDRGELGVAGFPRNHGVTLSANATRGEHYG